MSKERHKHDKKHKDKKEKEKPLPFGELLKKKHHHHHKKEEIKVNIKEVTLSGIKKLIMLLCFSAWWKNKGIRKRIARSSRNWTTSSIWIRIIRVLDNNNHYLHVIFIKIYREEKKIEKEIIEIENQVESNIYAKCHLCVEDFKTRKEAHVLDK